MDIYYIDRKTKEKKKEIVAGERALNWIYDTNMGKSMLEIFIKRKIFSYIYGKLQDQSFSKKNIGKFVKNLQIDLKEAMKEDPKLYENFNDFFARRLKKSARPIDSNENRLIAPADGRLLVYENIRMDQVIQVKGSFYDLGTFLKDKDLAKEYEGGVCVVIRLCPADYHRYHFPDGGISEKAKKIKGMYYSVNPIALKKIVGLYCQNKREITIFHSKHFGKMILSEVGATCVGSIIQTFKEGKEVERGEEKGYFKFGGSTVIMFLKKGQVQMDDDLIQYTKKGIEVKVDMGEEIGKRA